MSSNEASVRIKPRLAPRNLSDLVVAAIVAPIQWTCLFFFPALVATTLSKSSNAGLMAAIGCYLIFLAYSVRSISLDMHGIKFHRLLGNPKFLSWSSIQSIEEASRAELIAKGWLWPIFPAREMSASMSSTRHYKISWSTGFCYYPPKDTILFLELVSKYHAPNPALQRTASGGR